MDTLRRVRELRSAQNPLVAFWSVGEERVLGSLVWQDRQPKLTLLIEISNAERLQARDLKHPILEITKPPKQPNITGVVPSFGLITLEHCAQCRVCGSTNIKTGVGVYEVEFLPTRMWLGCEFESANTRVSYVVASDTRIAGFFGSPSYQRLWPSEPENEAIFERFGKSKTIWEAEGPEISDVSVGETDYLLDVASGVTESHSSTSGTSLHSTTEIKIKAKDSCLLSEMRSIVYEFEQMLSIFSVESFSFEIKEFCCNPFERISLVWQLGDDLTLFKAPMRHQILVDFKDEANLRMICEKWFAPNETQKLSRWLFARAIEETDNGTARFVQVAQALEVLGREYGPQKKTPKCKLREAVTSIRSVLAGKHEQDFIDRIISLIQSSNKSSFQDVLYHMLERPACKFMPRDDKKLREFCKLISETRNALVHMTDDNDGHLTAAFGRVNKLSMLLCFWYALVLADVLGLSVVNPSGFLANNRNTRHGLPNEILER